MEYYFDTLVDRREIGNMKGAIKDELPDNQIMLLGAEMDYATAPVIREAIIRTAQRGLFGFTLPDADYMDSICWWMKNIRNIELIEDSMIVPTLGTILGLSTAVRAFTDPGDGVIIQHPSYYRFDRAIVRNGRNVISNPMKESDAVYSIDWEDLEHKMSEPSNKMLVLCNPHNPTGKVFDKFDLFRISELAEKYNVIVFSDEIFAETASKNHPAIAYITVDKKNGISSTSLGKCFNLTGVNHANLIIPNEELRKRYLEQRDIDHFGSIDPFFYAALRAAYSPDGKAWIDSMNQYNQKNYEEIEKNIRVSMPLLKISPMEATYVAWIDCRQLNLSDDELELFWTNAGISIDPGIEYGEYGSGFVRINIATTRQQITEMLNRLVEAYNKHFGIGERKCI